MPTPNIPWLPQNIWLKTLFNVNPECPRIPGTNFPNQLNSRKTTDKTARFLLALLPASNTNTMLTPATTKSVLFKNPPDMATLL